MATGETFTVQITGGGPWGFRLYGGDDDPLVVAKLRKRSKAHEAGLEEGDVILGINNYSCKKASHGTAMSLVESAKELVIRVLRGATDKHAVDAAFQTLGAQLQPITASSLPQGQVSGPGPQFSSPSSQANKPQAPTSQNQYQVVNGYSAPAAPKKFSRDEQTFRHGDSTTHVTTETSKEQVGGTTITKVKRETFTESYGQQPSMFKVSNVVGAVPTKQQTGVWSPAGSASRSAGSSPAPPRSTGFKVSAPRGVHVEENPDQSVTMTIGMHKPMELDSKENIAPRSQQQKPMPSMFHVSKFGSNTTNQPKPEKAQQWAPGKNIFVKPEPNEEFPLLPDEEADYVAKLDALKKPFPVHLQKILIETGSDGDSAPQSPSYLTRSRMDSFNEDEESLLLSKKKMFADSAFYDDPEHKYPTIEEQVKMARKVAMSLLAPVNKKARGHRMFIRRMVKSQKWTTDDEHTESQFDLADDEEEEKYFNPNPWDIGTHTWQPVKVVPSAAPAPSVPSGFIPAAPPLPAPVMQPKLPFAGPRKEEKTKALSADEFERMRLFESKTEHTGVSPQMCFSLAQDLRNMKGKGGKLFAKRVARAEKWDDEKDESGGGIEKKPNQDLINKIAMQAAAGGAVRMPGMGAVSAPKKSKDDVDSGGMPVNRLKKMIDPPKPKMSPWDAAAENADNIDPAFDHLKGYNPYGRSHKGEIAEKLESAASRQAVPSSSSSSVGANPNLPTSGQPAKLPEYTRKIKPWGNNGESGQFGSGASFSAPPPKASQPAAPTTDGFRSVKFSAGGSSLPAPSGTQQRTSPALSSGSYSNQDAGAAFGGEEGLGYCDL